MFKKLLGVVLILVGIVGLFLPFIQGIAMILAGLVLLGNSWALKKMKALQAYWQRKSN